MDINASTLRSIYTGLSTAFNARFSSTPTRYGLVAMEVNSTTAQNEYPRLDELPGIREWIGERHVVRLGAQTYTIKNRKFEETVGILRDQIEDDQIGVFVPVAGQIGQHAAEFPDQLCWPMFASGETALCYDGQYFFDTDHPGWNEQGNEISVSNFTNGAGPAWYLVDDTQVVKPLVYQKRKSFNLVSFQDEKDPNVFMNDEFIWGTAGRCNAGFGMWQTAHKSKAALTPENFSAARVAMQTIRKRNGSVISLRPAKLIVPPALEGTARAILEAERNDAGATNIWRNTAQVEVVPYLA
ncbi:Mu-like prophage major head subunit gpT family protein [uncultured Martelella sp.]|uniref:Mu-like prophage major head subunit gpT family protein n=1 Tax=uncultured Martelella sp. TaxID=392331 RepID=UPI0029C6CB13|nr:Mu-like prophage major head subunit gpT family protein [uncultured Martelella sp.]